MQATLGAAQDFVWHKNIGVALEFTILVDLVVEQFREDGITHSLLFYMFLAGAPATLASTNSQLVLNCVVAAADCTLLPPRLDAISPSTSILDGRGWSDLDWATLLEDLSVPISYWPWRCVDQSDK